MPRLLNSHEKTLWGRVIATVEPLHRVKAEIEPAPSAKPSAPQKKVAPAKLLVAGAASVKAAAKAATKPDNLDGHWNKRIHRGGISPDISIDLHDASLSRAYARLDGALEQAIAQKLKVILLVTGKPRAHDRTSGEGRGAIASVVRDWLAASRHASHISAVRNAHPKHGGSGALYIVLKN